MCHRCGEDSAEPEVCAACADVAAALSGWVACSEGHYPGAGEYVMVAWRNTCAPPANGAPLTYVRWDERMERGGVTHWMRIPPVREAAQ